MTRKFKAAAVNSLIALAAFLLTLLALELGLRLTGETDADGNATALGVRAQPQSLPLSQLLLRIDDYLAREEWATYIYDPLLGWAPSPERVWPQGSGSYSVNRDGIRAPRDYSREPPPASLRIAVFGDSFTEGNEVADEHTWPRQLERRLNEAGLRAEVLNFGVSAYGMGQAYLRWRHLGKAFAPDIVLFGLQPENLKRNVNVFRQLLNPAGMPFSKPRFARIDGELALLNAPALPPEELIATFERFAEHPLARWEYHYQDREAAAQWWNFSWLANLLYAWLDADDADPGVYAPGSEGGDLGKAILSAFAADAEAAGSVFAVIHLPLRSHLIRRFEGRDPPYKFLLDYARASYHYIATEERLHPPHVEDEYWAPNAHYSEALTPLIGQIAADWLIDCLRTEACQIPRLQSEPEN